MISWCASDNSQPGREESEQLVRLGPGENRKAPIFPSFPAFESCYVLATAAFPRQEDNTEALSFGFGPRLASPWLKLQVPRHGSPLER